jgi:hypothetical protein
MRTLSIVLVAVAVLGAVVAAVGGYRLAGAADAPALGPAVVVETSPTTSTRPPRPASTTSSRAPAPTAAPVSPPPVQDAGDDEPDEDADDLDGD